MDKETYPDQRVVVLSKEFVFARINGKEDTVLCNQYNVAGFPTIIVANAKGDEIDRVVGFLPAGEFVNTINDYLTGKNTLAALEKELLGNPNDFLLNYKLGDKYSGRRQYDKAVVRYQQALDLDKSNRTGKADSAVYGIAMAAFSQKNYDKAIEQLQKVIELFPNTPLKEEVGIDTPIAYEKAKNKGKAIEFYQKYLDAFPQGGDRDYARKHLDSLKIDTKPAEK